MSRQLISRCQGARFCDIYLDKSPLLFQYVFFQSKLLYQSYFLTKFEQTLKKVIFKLFFFFKKAV